MQSRRIPTYEDGAPVGVDLWEMLNKGASGGLVLGRTSPGEAQALLGPANERFPGYDEGSLFLSFASGECFFRDGQRLTRLRFELYPRGHLEASVIGGPGGLANLLERGVDDVGLEDLWLGAETERVVYLDGHCASYFSTFPKLMVYRPRTLPFEVEAVARPDDKALRVQWKCETRELTMVFRLATFTVNGEEGSVHFDYCLEVLELADWGVLARAI